MLKRKNLIIGKKPPPIGGVTVHVSRLLHFLTREKVEYEFLSLLKNKKFQFLKLFFAARKIFLHSSNVYIRAGISFFGLLFKKEIILFIHGDLGRFNWFKNQVDYCGIKLAKIPIVINKNSFEKARNINKNAVRTTAFLPPTLNEQVKEPELENEFKIDDFLSNHEFNFCTNAYNYALNDSGKEIYGVLPLVELFSKIPEYGLIISDPSGAYYKILKNKAPKNVLVIYREHKFIPILLRCNGFIRNTITDGDSLSVKEGLYFGKKVFCTAIVDRPKGCFLYKNLNELENKILNISSLNSRFIDELELKNQIECYLSLYNATNHSRP